MFPVYLYTDINYGGFSRGVKYTSPANSILTDQITDVRFPSETLSSIKVAANTYVVLSRYRKQYLKIYGPIDIPDLGSYITPFDNMATTIQVWYKPMGSTIPSSTLPETKYPVVLYGGLNYSYYNGPVFYSTDSYATPILRAFSNIGLKPGVRSIKLGGSVQLTLTISTDKSSGIIITGPINVRNIYDTIPGFTKLGWFSILYTNTSPAPGIIGFGTLAEGYVPPEAPQVSPVIQQEPTTIITQQEPTTIITQQEPPAEILPQESTIVETSLQPTFSTALEPTLSSTPVIYTTIPTEEQQYPVSQPIILYPLQPTAVVPTVEKNKSSIMPYSYLFILFLILIILSVITYYNRSTTSVRSPIQ